MPETDRVSGHSPLHFDLSTFDVFGTFAAGATLYPVPPELNLLPRSSRDFIRDVALDAVVLGAVDAELHGQVRRGRPGDFPTLERLLWCGEVLPTPPLAYWMERLPHVRFTNLYGPTEATIASSYYTSRSVPRRDTESIPIGRACAGEELLVLDGDARPVPAGEVGRAVHRRRGR